VRLADHLTYSVLRGTSSLVHPCPSSLDELQYRDKISGAPQSWKASAALKAAAISVVTCRGITSIIPGADSAPRSVATKPLAAPTPQDNGPQEFSPCLQARCATWCNHRTVGDTPT